MDKHIEEVFFTKLKYITRLSLVCGVMITAVALSGCSGSEKAVQANAPVMSSGVMSTESSSEVNDINSSSSVTSSDLVSSNNIMTSGVTSQSSSSLNSDTSKKSSGTTSSKPTSAKPTSTKPASKTPTPASKPASKPVSAAPASKSVSTAPASASDSVSGKYHGATYGAESQAQYNEILNYASQVPSRSRYSKSYDFDAENQSVFESATGVAYSEDANKVTSIIGCFQNAGASGSTGNAYIAYTQGSSNCGDDAKAIQAALNVAGYNCKLVWGTDASGTSHMWTSTYFDGAWHEWGRAKFSSGTPAGFTESGSGYNY